MRFPNGLGRKRPNVSGTWAETESFHTSFSRSRPPFLSKSNESGWLGAFEVWEFSPDLRRIGIISKLYLFCGILKNGGGHHFSQTSIFLRVFEKADLSGFWVGSIVKQKCSIRSKWAHVKLNPGILAEPTFADRHTFYGLE